MTDLGPFAILAALIFLLVAPVVLWLAFWAIFLFMKRRKRAGITSKTGGGSSAADA